MPRSTEEWVGKTDDSAAPARVRVRLFNKYNGVCCCGCTRKITAGEAWQLDHIVALVNGGQNREGNLWPLLVAHHKEKTAKDVEEKSLVYKKRKKYLGIKKKSTWACGRDSKFKRKISGEVVVRK